MTSMCTLISLPYEKNAVVYLKYLAYFICSPTEEQTSISTVDGFPYGNIPREKPIDF